MKKNSDNIFGTRDISGMSRIEIYECLKECMQDRGLYEKSLDPAITMLASLFKTYMEAYEDFLDRMTYDETSREGNSRTILNPTFQVQATLSEQIRKYMRDLGLVVAKPAGFVSQSKGKDVPNQGDKLTTMLDMVAQPRMSVYKKTTRKKKEAE